MDFRDANVCDSETFDPLYSPSVNEVSLRREEDGIDMGPLAAIAV